MLDDYRRMLAEVRRTYTAEKRAEERRSDFFAYVLYRPVSFWVTPFFLRLGISADGATGLGFGVALAMPAAAWWAGPAAYGCVAALGVAMMVLDCVDGNLARLRGGSPVGHMLDGACTLFFWTGYFAAVGALAEGADGSWVARHGRELGLVLAVAMFAQRALEDGFEEAAGERVRWEPPLPTRSGGLTLAEVGRPLEQVAAFGGLVLAGALDRLTWFAGGLAVYQLTLLALWVPRFVRAVAVRSRGGR